jgi:uncharacterized protein
MPVPLTYPGVYIEELPSGVRTITGVATSVAAFVGRAWRGPVDEPVTLFSYADYERNFGGLWRDSTMSYAVQQFFQNGGSQAVIVRLITHNAQGDIDTTAFATTIDLGSGFQLVAASPGTWADDLKATIDLNTKDAQDPTPQLFNLTLFDDPDEKSDQRKLGGSGLRETFLNVSMDATHPRFVGQVLSQQSVLARLLAPASPAARPAAKSATFGTGAGSAAGSDGSELVDADVVGKSDPKTGIFALKKTDIFNLLCLPPLTPGADGTDIDTSTWATASQFCRDHRAFLLVDAPQVWDVTAAIDTSPAGTGIGAFGALDRNHGAIYFPRLLVPDPLQENRLDVFAPCGAVAGVYSRTDSARGVWKAPAGIDTNLQGVLGLAIKGQLANLTDGEVGQLNPLGINSLRGLPVIGNVVWGARTIEGADVLASQWKYVPVRRLALYIEESLFRGTQWVVFEPNDEPLWAQIRLNVGAFMQTLFRQGAFQGSSPKDAYFVKCSSETTTQTDIDNGVVNIIVGFAPLKPAEFVVIKIQQIAQQA